MSARDGPVSNSRSPLEIIPFPVFLSYSRLFSQVGRRDWTKLSERQLWEELCLCILSSSGKFEAAWSATGRLKRSGLLKRLREEPRKVTPRMVAEVLLARDDHGSRKMGVVRFPKIKADRLVKTARIVYGGGVRLGALLKGFGSAEEARDSLVGSIPGIGMKQASHYLQRIGYSSDLAVIDVHVLRFFADEMRTPRSQSASLGQQEYTELERRFQWLASSNGLEPRVLDLAIWSEGRR